VINVSTIFKGCCLSWSTFANDIPGFINILSLLNLFQARWDYSSVKVYFNSEVMHFSFIEALITQPKRFLHLIFPHNVRAICITETSGTYFVSAFHFFIIVEKTWSFSSKPALKTTQNHWIKSLFIVQYSWLRFSKNLAVL
jgi:hypothetical protein